VVDNIFIDISKFENYITILVFNGLSDDDAQLLTYINKSSVVNGPSQNIK
jgi:hypothetical protein